MQNNVLCLICRFRKSLQFDVLKKEKIPKGKSVIEKKKAITDSIFKKMENKNITPDFIKSKKLHGTLKKQWFWTRKSKNVDHTN